MVKNKCLGKIFCSVKIFEVPWEFRLLFVKDCRICLEETFYEIKFGNK